jgi:alpha-galactosidase
MTRFVLPSVLFAIALSGPARAAGPVSADLWKPEHAPFSFTYGGKPSSQILSSWQTSHGLSPVTDGLLYHYIYTDPATKLTVIAEVRTFRNFPAVDWVLRFRNDGTADTPIIENIEALDLSLAAAPGDCIVHHARGSTADAQDFAPLDEHLNPGGNLHFESSNGRSSDGAIMA